MKTTVLQATILIAASVVVALVYNAFSNKSLPLVHEEQKVTQVSDDELFSDSPAQEQTPTGEAPVPQEQNGITSEPSVAQSPKGNETTSNEHAATAKPTAEKIGAEVTKPVEQGSQKPPKEHANEAAEHVSATVTYEQVKKLAADPNVLFIDARNAEEYGQGHIGNAINIFTPEFEQNIPKVITLPRDKRVVVYCGGGACELSHELAAHMSNLGFQRVYVYTGGWHEWTKKQEQK